MGYKITEETRQKLRLSHLGQVQTEEAKLKNRLWHLGRKNTPEHNRNISKGHLGIKMSEENKKKLSLRSKGKKYHLGKKHSEETRKKMSIIGKTKVGPLNSFYGKHHTEETKEKIRQANNLGLCGMKGKKWSEETRKKQIIARLGEKSHLWFGGKSFEPYTLDFNIIFKESIRERDNYCCVICNKSQEELGYKLCVHHIDYDKKNSFKENCVSLCKNHHMDTNLNRQYWKTFFQSLLKERYGYEYTQDQKVILDFTKEGV